MKFRLPVSETKLKSFLQLEGSALDTFLKSLRHDEIAALLLIPSLFSNKDDLNTDKKVFFFLNSQLSRLVPALLQSREQMWEVPKSAFTINPAFNDIELLLSDLKIELMSDSEIQRNEHLIAGMDWKSQSLIPERQFFSEKYPNISNDGQEYVYESQERFITDFLANNDEPTVVQGYAGIGKSTMTRMIVEGLNKRHGSKPLYLTRNLHQMRSVKRSHIHINAITFAHAINVEFVRDTSFLYQNTDHKKAAQYFAFPPIGPLDHYKSYLAARITVNSFCYSSDDEITEEHLPKFVFSHKAQHLANANVLWSTLCSMSPSTPVALEWHHKMKIISLRNLGFTRLSASHLIFDEGHDVYPAFQKIINNSRIPTLVFKDDFQNLVAAQYTKSSNHRIKELSQSIRQGSQLEGIVGMLTNSGYYNYATTFKGSKDKETTITEYKNLNDLPKPPCAIIGSSINGLSLVIFKLQQQGASFTLLPNTYKSIVKFYTDAKLVNKGLTHEIRNPALAGVKSWEAYFEKNKIRNPSESYMSFLQNNERIDQMLNRLRETQDIQGSTNNYTLAFAEHSKSLEFKRVIVLDELLNANQRHRNGSLNQANAQANLNKLYLSLTRATNEIYMPSQFEGKTQDMVAVTSRLLQR